MNLETVYAKNEFSPATPDELGRFLAENHAGAKRALAPVGGRTALDFGYPLSRPAVTVSVGSLARVIDFPARDMTVTVEAGIRIDQLADILRAEGQRLPIDVPQSNRATLGGVAATNTSGPRRFGYGTMRDYVLGMTAIAADGRTFHSGGRVVKNVAGYDMCKLLVGSMGTLAVLTQLTLKLKPLPESSALVWALFENAAALEAAVAGLVASATRPVAVETLNPAAAAAIEGESRTGLPVDGSLLIVGFEGAARETDWQIEAWRQEVSSSRPSDIQPVRDADADRLWTALAEFPVSADEPLAFQANVLPSRVAAFVERASASNVAVLAHAGDGVVIGKLPDDVADAAAAARALAPLTALAETCGGQLVLLTCDPAWKSTMPVTAPSAPVRSLMRGLKTVFDPDDLLNPGRMFAD